MSICTFLESQSFSVSSVAQALPELPEDVLRVHADAVQWSSMAQHHSAYYG